MPGLSLVVGSAISRAKVSTGLADLQGPYSAAPEVLFNDNHLLICFSGHEGYPRHYFEDDVRVILFEGVVYNRPVDATHGIIESIGDQFAKQREVRPLLRDFVDSSDGDYLCAIYSKRTTSLLTFNDRYGRLPAFYHAADDSFVLSRELKFLLHWLPTIAIDRLGLAQQLMFGYALGERTLFQRLCMLPASCAAKSRVAVPAGKVRISIDQLLPLNFDETREPLPRTQCVDRILQIYRDSIKDRYVRCGELGLSSLVDVSGGFDTRTVVGGIETIGADVEYFTHKLVTGDESHVARQVCDLYGRPICVVAASHERDHGEYEELVYATDGLVNGWTALTSWRDVSEKRQLVGAPAATFMGLGGGLIRHPFKRPWGHGSLTSMLQSNLLRCSLSPEWVGYLTGLGSDELISCCGDYFDTYSEKTLDGRLKRFYYEYLHTRVSSGEDRARRVFWPVQPLWSKDAYGFVMNEMPLRYANYSFHTDLLRNMDPRLLTVPIYGDSVRLESKTNVHLHDLRATLKRQLKVFTHYNRLTNRLNFQRTTSGRDRQNLRTMGQLIVNAHGSLSSLGDCIAKPRVEEFLRHGYGMTNYDRLLSLLVYFKQVEERFSQKISPQNLGE